jgi:hypothetical protein
MGTMSFKTLQPVYGSGVTISAGAASTNTFTNSGASQLCITALNNVQCYVRVGGVSAVATTADYPIPVGGQVTITKNPEDDYIAVIAPAGGGSLHVMEGDGF